MNILLKPQSLFIILVTLLYFFVIRFGWVTTWNFLNIPTMLPPHWDLRFYQYGAAAIEYGYNPLKYGPKEWINLMAQTNSQHSEYFLAHFQIAHFFKIYDEIYFLIFANILIIAYFASCYKIISLNKNSYWVLILIFSNAQLLGLERTNNDLIIFIFLYISAIFPNIFGAITYFFAVIIELWPAMAGISFIKKKIKLYLIFFIIIYFIYNFRHLNNLLPIPTIEGFGSKTIELFLLSNFSSLKINYFLINIILISFALIILLFSRKYKFLNFEFKRKHNEVEERLFLIGATLYCCLFIITYNHDYKLIFLIFCVPYVSKIKNLFQKYFIMIAMIISSNLGHLYQINLNIFDETISSLLLNLVFKSIIFIILLNLLIKYFLNLLKENDLKKILFK